MLCTVKTCRAEITNANSQKFQYRDTLFRGADDTRSTSNNKEKQSSTWRVAGFVLLWAKCAQDFQRRPQVQKHVLVLQLQALPRERHENMAQSPCMFHKKRYFTNQHRFWRTLLTSKFAVLEPVPACLHGSALSPRRQPCRKGEGSGPRRALHSCLSVMAPPSTRSIYERFGQPQCKQTVNPPICNRHCSPKHLGRSMRVFEPES